MRLMLLTAIVLALACLTPAKAAASAIPQVTFAVPGLIEGYCSRLSPVKPDPAALDEVRARLPEFVAAWEKDGPRLLNETVSVSGVPYRFNETLASLHTCPDLFSASAPLMIAVARYTAASGGNSVSGLIQKALDEGRPLPPKTAPLSFDRFVYTVWHELQHRWLTDLFKGLKTTDTPMLRKYASESEITRNHLYLYAVERIVLRRLGREQEYFDRRAEAIRSGGSDSHLRAMLIVDAETPEKVLDDLKLAQP